MEIAEVGRPGIGPGQGLGEIAPAPPRILPAVHLDPGLVTGVGQRVVAGDPDAGKLARRRHPITLPEPAVAVLCARAARDD